MLVCYKPFHHGASYISVPHGESDHATSNLMRTCDSLNLTQLLLKYESKHKLYKCLHMIRNKGLAHNAYK
jgi:hypothetical protein